MRKVININNCWKFIKQNEEEAMKKVYNDESWESINIPHTWNAIDGANGFDFYKGACWYRKVFNIDKVEQGNRVYIEFN
jgi:beta-galactosidase